jgi:hypothetical protein
MNKRLPVPLYRKIDSSNKLISGFRLLTLEKIMQSAL